MGRYARCAGDDLTGTKVRAWPALSPTAIPEIRLMRRSGATVYRVSVMNENSSSNSSTSAPHRGLTADAISRRAYELWEKEGRPENRDLHHWLRAEQELLAEQGKAPGQSGNASSASSSRNEDWLAPEKELLQQNRSGNAQNPSGSRAANTDQPLQGARPSGSNKSGKRGSAAPFSPEKSTQRSSPPSSTRTPGRG